MPEYWLLDPVREVAEFYQLDERGHYQLIAPDTDGVYRSRMLPGFWLRVGWRWQDPLPRPIRALGIDRDAYAHYLRDELRRAGTGRIEAPVGRHG